MATAYEIKNIRKMSMFGDAVYSIGYHDRDGDWVELDQARHAYDADARKLAVEKIHYLNGGN